MIWLTRLHSQPSLRRVLLLWLLLPLLLLIPLTAALIYGLALRANADYQLRVDRTQATPR